MKIVDIFKNHHYSRLMLNEAVAGRFSNDHSGFAGSVSECALCKAFNKDNKDYKLYNPALLKIVDKQFQVNYGNFADDLSDLHGKTKKPFGKLSACDFFLFKVDGDTRTLIDAKSLKTSIPSDKKPPEEIFLHNDATGEIHDAVKSGKISNLETGGVILAIYREGKAAIYHYDGKLNKLIKNNKLVAWNSTDKKTKTTRQIGLKIVSPNYGVGKLPDYTLSFRDRGVRTGTKDTSLNRGIRINVKSTLKINPFDALNSLVKDGSFEQICEFKFDNSLIAEILTKNYSL